MRRPKAYLVHRVAEYGVTLLAAITLNFFLPRLMPGDPLALIAGDAVRQMGPERIAALRHAYGLDLPLAQQYLVYLERLLHLDLGDSYRYSGGRSVAQTLAERFRWTLFLVGVSLTLAVAAGALLGAWAAWRHGKTTDLGLLTLLFTLRSVPPFWLAMLLIPLVAVRWHLLPSGDSFSFPRPVGVSGALDVLLHAVLPVGVLTLSYLPVAFGVMRSSLLGILGSDYIRSARAKGLTETGILYRHAARNALLPLATAVTLDFGQMLGGVTLIETVFNYRGLGSMMFEAVKSRDYPLLQGGFLLFTVCVLALNLFSDWLYGRLDPRLRDRAV